MMSPGPHILLRTANPQLLARWRAALDPLDGVISGDAGSEKNESKIDVVLTDSTVGTDDQSCDLTRLVEAEAGVILFDTQGPADVHLLPEATDREIQLAVCLLTEIVRLRRQRKQGDRIHSTLRHMAMTDSLTGLPNRRAWEERLRLQVEHADQTQDAVCLTIYDVDFFKVVNDRAGHATGDMVLKKVADALVASLREPDFVARLGGDEFGVLFNGLGWEVSAGVVDRVRTACSQALPDNLPQVTLSAGFAVHRRGASADALSLAADEALRWAKSNGRNKTAASNRKMRYGQ
ncbi:MAG: hypothetical protein CMJ81_05825 [Planctomycetaceae bacterium]|nr:hypothetical protein [Planctomycetaceae bacterium]MBP63411.1 hypothetical protein [Planctomycetaceae bacterium]